MKRFVAVLITLSLVLCMVPLAGCSTAAYKEPVLLDLWHYYTGPQQDALNQLVSEFNDTIGAQQGIVVEAVSQGNVGQLTAALLASAENAVGSQEMPDIFAAYADTAHTIDQMGRVASLDSYFSKKEQAAYLPGYLEEGRIAADGALKIFPVAKSTELMILNKTDWDAFAAATGADVAQLATIEGVTRTAGQYYDWSGGKAMFGRDAMANYMLIGSMQLGHELFQVQNGQVTLGLDKPTMRRLWDNYYVPYLQGWFTHFGKFASDDIKSGDTIAFVGSTSGAAYFPQEVNKADNTSYPIDVLILPAPIFADGQPYAVQQGAGMVVAKSDSRTEQAAVTFLKWFTQPQQNLRFAFLGSYLPVTTAASSEQALDQYLEQHKDVKPVLAQALRVSIQTTATHQMYTNRAFTKGNDARKVLESSMSSRATADRQLLEEQIAAGTPREEALAVFLSEESFDSWYQSLCSQLQSLLG